MESRFPIPDYNFYHQDETQEEFHINIKDIDLLMNVCRNVLKTIDIHHRGLHPSPGSIVISFVVPPRAVAVLITKREKILSRFKDHLVANRISSLPQISARLVSIHASGNGHTDTAKMLIENGANLEVKDNHGKTPLIYASGNGHADIAKMLIENGAHIIVTVSISSLKSTNWRLR